MTIQFHRSDVCVTEGNKCAVLTPAETAMFYQLWSNKGKWLGDGELLIGFHGRPIPSEDPAGLVHRHITRIRRKLRKAEIDISIDNQHQSFWADRKYRIKTETKGDINDT